MDSGGNGQGVFGELTKHDVYFLTRRAPRRAIELLKSQPGAVLAGGFIRSVISREDCRDVDIFAPTKEAARAYADFLAAPDRPDGKPRRIHETDNAYTVFGLGLPVQVIHRWLYDTPEALLASFDFTIAQAALWFDASTQEWCSLVGPRFYQDLAAKRLVYLSPERNEDAGGSILRLLKFYYRGYTAPLDTVGAVIARLLQGVSGSGLWREGEGGRARVLTGLLREVDPLLDPWHVFHQPSMEMLEEETAQSDPERSEA